MPSVASPFTNFNARRQGNQGHQAQAHVPDPFQRRAPALDRTKATAALEKLHAGGRANHARNAPEAEDDALDPTSTAYFDRVFEKFKENFVDTENPRTKRDHIRHETLWHAFMLERYPDIEDEQIWDEERVLRFAPAYVLWLYQNTPPITGRESLKAATLENWPDHLIQNITNYAVNSNGERVRWILLTQKGLYKTCRDNVMNVLWQCNLDRTMNPHIYYGRAEVRLVIETILASRTASRLAQIQTITRIVLTMFIAWRPLSMAPTNDVMVLLERASATITYIRLKDIRIIRTGPMTFIILLHGSEFKPSPKGHLMTVSAAEQYWKLMSVLFAHNALFDPTLWILLFLFARNTLTYTVPTPLLVPPHLLTPTQCIEEFATDTAAEVKIKPEKLDEPLFLAVSAGGRNLSAKAGKSHGISQAATYWACKAGLPGGGNGTYRRDASDKVFLVLFGQQIGDQAAKDILNHAILGVYRQFYSRNTVNHDVVRIRLGEIAGNLESEAGQKLKEATSRDVYMEYAVEALLRTKAKAVDPNDIRSVAAQAKLNKSSHPGVTQEQQEQVEAAALLDPKYLQAMEAQHLNLELKKACEGTEIQFSSAFQESNLLSVVLETKKAFKRSQYAQIQQAYNLSLRDTTLTGTFEQRNEAVTSLQAKHATVIEQEALQLHETTSPLDDPLNCSPPDLQERRELIAAMALEEESEQSGTTLFLERINPPNKDLLPPQAAAQLAEDDDKVNSLTDQNISDALQNVIITQPDEREEETDRLQMDAGRMCLLLMRKIYEPLAQDLLSREVTFASPSLHPSEKPC
ncbi:hypothetical protein B0H11DRAFT_1939751 [Mycena galericulata]|nr:hypothetical protein B0H11DRAFT_1939751 [Mycena galericulata]